MEKKTILGGAMAGLVLSGSLMGAVLAQAGSDTTEQVETQLTEAQAIEIALQNVPGEVQEIELEKEDGVMIYEIEVVKADGQEFEIEIAADSGTVLEVEAEDDDDDDDKDDT